MGLHAVVQHHVTPPVAVDATDTPGAPRPRAPRSLLTAGFSACASCCAVAECFRFSGIDRDANFDILTSLVAATRLRRHGLLS